MSNASTGQMLDDYNTGRFEEAASACRAILAVENTHPEANHFLGIIYFQQGETDIALDFLERATRTASATPEMHNNHGVVLNLLGDIDEAETAFARALAAKPDYSEALNNIGSVHRVRGNTAQAVESFRRAIALKPNYAEAIANLRAVYGDVIPAWHFAMMNDGFRNDAYDAAIRRAVAGKQVLEIGTGAGLLAMMAARASAAHVTTCEKVALVAEQARVIVSENGLTDRITIIGKASSELEIGVDLGARAELLVTEIFSSGLLNEGVLPAIEHAHEKLLIPGATIIPRSASAIGYLIGGEALRDKLFTERASGFSVAAFNDFAPFKIGLSLDREPHDVLSDDVELIRFDLTRNRFPMTAHHVSIKATQQGQCVGVAQWLQLDLLDGIRYANRPSPDTSSGGWTHIVYRFPRIIDVEPGQIIRVIVRHNREQLFIDLPE